MPRALRIEYPGVIYHVLNFDESLAGRGDRREAIFRDDADRKRFVESLGGVRVGAPSQG
jgi:putative transposase